MAQKKGTLRWALRSRGDDDLWDRLLWGHPATLIAYFVMFYIVPNPSKFLGKPSWHAHGSQTALAGNLGGVQHDFMRVA